jgi:acyl-CoA thioester hydrolase
MKTFKKIHYHDTDCGGVVYYANYLKYFEEARTEYLLDKGVDIIELAKVNVWFAVRRVETDYKAPARYGDRLTILTKITKVKNASLEFLQEARREDGLLVSARTQLVCINREFSARALPGEVIENLKENDL